MRRVMGEAKVWDAKTGAELLELKGLQEGVNSVAISPDGTRIITAGGGPMRNIGAELKVWNALTGAILFDLSRPVLLGAARPPDHRGASVAWECDESNGHVVTVVVGAPTIDDWSTVALQQMVSTDRQSIAAHLIDARDCDLTNIITADVADIAVAYALHDRRGTPLRRAVVANDALGLATALHSAVPAGAMPVVFNDLTAACRWLGIDRNEASTIVERLHAAIDELTAN